MRLLDLLLSVGSAHRGTLAYHQNQQGAQLVMPLPTRFRELVAIMALLRTIDERIAFWSQKVCDAPHPPDLGTIESLLEQVQLRRDLLAASPTVIDPQVQLVDFDNEFELPPSLEPSIVIPPIRWLEPCDPASKEFHEGEFDSSPKTAADSRDDKRTLDPSEVTIIVDENRERLLAMTPAGSLRVGRAQLGLTDTEWMTLVAFAMKAGHLEPEGVSPKDWDAQRKRIDRLGEKLTRALDLSERPFYKPEGSPFTTRLRSIRRGTRGDDMRIGR